MIAALALVALQVAEATPPAGAAARTPYWVSSRTGDDAAGDGSEEQPFRSLTRALRAAKDAGAVPDLRVDVGEYSVEHGESFPLDLPLGARLRGLTAEYTVLRASGEALAIRVSGEERGELATVLDSLQILGADAGVVASARRTLLLSNLLVRECAEGVIYDGTDGRVDLRIVGTRVEDCTTGVRVIGGRGPGRVELRNCALSRGETGVHLLASAHVDGFALDAQASTIRDYATGVLREGGPSRGGDRFESCTFQSNRMGIEFRLAEGDRGVSVKDCHFLGNEVFGIRLVGRDGSRGLRTTIHDSEFRWNGVGIHLVNLLHPVEVARCLVVDNVGNGIFVSCYPAANGEAQAVIRDSLLADNGACGVQTHSDGRTLRAEIRTCTFANNGTAGVARVNKHKGDSTVTVSDCVLAGPAPATDNVPAEALENCWTGLDPDFVDPETRDYRLRRKSPAGKRGAPALLLAVMAG